MGEGSPPLIKVNISEKPTLSIKLDALKFLVLNSYWREGGFLNSKGWGPSENLFDNGRQMYQ